MKKVIRTGNDQDIEWLTSHLEDLDPEKYYSVEIKKYRNTRSQHQNAYYWGVVVNILSKELGYDSDEIHEILKAKFNTKKTILPNGEEVEHVDTTTNKDTYEFNLYIEEIQRWASQELGIYIPDPEEFEN